MSVKTREQVIAELARKGITRAQWAAANGLSRFVVYQVLMGKHQGRWGQAHRAAVLLGLKEGEIVQPNQIKDALASAAQRRAA